ncbi:DNA translocase FtsK [Tepidibacter formicigenes]|uniref:DNA segregation ATPase FtsK/SpoIIIE, S-DNA-T family n=1 Tax=Tepidibacter formicigenes DSM 15518 TaxID=1123349 RepID=A0A1M6JDH0_9FIRM|nr:DNA translocase FtsK [Tepidibacter formicigenes]SHJ44779.1 DNA segregation ATPase FtsK/SpoIIIE, S-DNA-T family [Tepidibacter formicigenes DSM 15518]
MSKRRNKKEKKNQIKLDSKFKQEFNSLSLIFLGLFLSYSLKTDSMGKIGYFIKVMFLGFFSKLSIIIPYIIIFLGIIHLINNDELKKIKSYKLYYPFIFIAMLIYGLMKKDFIPIDSPFLPENLKVIFSISIEGSGSGMFSTIIAYYFIKLFGVKGSYIVSIFCLIIIVLFSFNISIEETINKIKSLLVDNFVVFKSFVVNFVTIEEKPTKKRKNKKIVNINNEIAAETEVEQSIKIVDFNKNLQDNTEIIENNYSTDKKETKFNDKNDEKEIESKKELNKDNQEIKIITNSESEKFLDYKKPSTDLLFKANNIVDPKDKKQILKNAKLLEKTLKDFGVEAQINQVTKGPTITRYEIQPKAGVKVSKIVGLVDDIALSLAAKSIRIEAPIPGKSAIGIEVPNDEVQLVTLREVIESDEFSSNNSKLSFGLGKDISGRPIITDIAKMPHLLIAGATGSGKSVCVNTLINSILYKAKPDEVKFLMIDPKVVELTNYNGIPHLLIPVVTDPKKAAYALNWAVTEMNRRYKLFAENSVRDITGYNEKVEEKLPKVVIIIDELADLMMVSPNEVEDAICRLAQMARAAGMHLIVATQRPSVDVITGVIKANIPSRIAFSVSSQADSRTILDMGGAEKLLGKGDMLFYPVGSPKPVRLQGAFISDKEVESVVNFVKSQVEEVNYTEDIIENINKGVTFDSSDEDDLLSEAIGLVVNAGQASASMLQRKFRIGYNRAARLIDQMEERGLIGPSEGSKPRKVLITKEEYESTVGE